MRAHCATVRRDHRGKQISFLPIAVLLVAKHHCPRLSAVWPALRVRFHVVNAHGWNGVHVVFALEALHFGCVNHVIGVKGLQAVMFLTVRV